MTKSQAIADRISFILEQKGLNRLQFASLMGIQPSSITKWLSGNHNFTLETLVKIESALGEPVIKIVSSPQISLKFRLLVGSESTRVLTGDNYIA